MDIPRPPMARGAVIVAAAAANSETAAAANSEDPAPPDFAESVQALLSALERARALELQAAVAAAAAATCQFQDRLRSLGSALAADSLERGAAAAAAVPADSSERGAAATAAVPADSVEGGAAAAAAVPADSVEYGAAAAAAAAAADDAAAAAAANRLYTPRREFKAAAAILDEWLAPSLEFIRARGAVFQPGADLAEATALNRAALEELMTRCGASEHPACTRLQCETLFRELDLKYALYGPERDTRLAADAMLMHSAWRDVYARAYDARKYRKRKSTSEFTDTPADEDGAAAPGDDSANTPAGDAVENLGGRFASAAPAAEPDSESHDSYSSYSCSYSYSYSDDEIDPAPAHGLAASAAELPAPPDSDATAPPAAAERPAPADGSIAASAAELPATAAPRVVQTAWGQQFEISKRAPIPTRDGVPPWRRWTCKGPRSKTLKKTSGRGRRPERSMRSMAGRFSHQVCAFQP